MPTGNPIRLVGRHESVNAFRQWAIVRKLIWCAFAGLFRSLGCFLDSAARPLGRRPGTKTRKLEIQPTRTIIHNPDGSTTVITVARRSYLDPGTDVPLGYPGTKDWAFPPGGDPGQPYWFYGPDQHGVGGVVLAPWFRLPGINPPNGPTE